MAIEAVLSTPTMPARRRRIPAGTAIAFLLMLVVVVLVVAGPWIAPHDPSRQDPLMAALGPSQAHWLGTDDLGRDVFSRALVGARSAIVGPAIVAAACVLLGSTLGVVAGYSGGWIEAIVNRAAEMVYALPALLVAVVVVGVAGGGYWITVAVLVGLSFPYQARVCRGATLAQSRLPYVDAARTLGLPAWRIMFRHLLPNILPTLVTTLLLDFVGALIGFSALDYLGLGVAPGTADWGVMISDGQQYIPANPWFALFPALLLVATAASVTLLGDWVYDAVGRRIETAR